MKQGSDCENLLKVRWRGGPTNGMESSVAEPSYFGPAPAPASPDGGHDSSSSTVIHNLLLTNFFLFHLLIYWGLFYSQKVTEGFLLFQYLT